MLWSSLGHGCGIGLSVLELSSLTLCVYEGPVSLPRLMV